MHSSLCLEILLGPFGIEKGTIWEEIPNLNYLKFYTFIKDTKIFI